MAMRFRSRRSRVRYPCIHGPALHTCKDDCPSPASRADFHPVAGASFEGLAIESLIAAAPIGTEAHFFRTAVGAEIDLILGLPGRRRPWAIEVRRELLPKAERGFHHGCETVRSERRLIVYGGLERFPPAEDREAIPLPDLCADLSAG